LLTIFFGEIFGGNDEKSKIYYGKIKCGKIWRGIRFFIFSVVFILAFLAAFVFLSNWRCCHELELSDWLLLAFASTFFVKLAIARKIFYGNKI